MQTDQLKPFQFSLRSLLLTMVAASVAMSLWKSMGLEVALAVGAWGVFFAPFIVAVVKSYDDPPALGFVRAAIVTLVVMLVPCLALAAVALMLFGLGLVCASI